MLYWGYRNPSEAIGDYPIHKSIKDGNLLELISIKDESTQASLHCFIDDCDGNGFTPLHLALSLGRFNYVQTLISNFNADVSYRALPHFPSAIDFLSDDSL